MADMLLRYQSNKYGAQTNRQIRAVWRAALLVSTMSIVAIVAIFWLDKYNLEMFPSVF